MLGQSKTAWQAEIDSACELIDFWRFNVHYGRQIIEEQPIANARGGWNRSDHRALEGFVYAVTPFNFTAIAGNLPTAPALTEYFGPILAVHVYEAVVEQMESVASYALTGAVIGTDRNAVAWTTETLRFAAGNFYINDKPTGAVVGQQPFGGASASGTNDKAGPPRT